MLERGYAALTVRGVAKQCGIAVGTVYNYFPSKDMLAAEVMLEDWLAAITAVQQNCLSAESPREAVRELYRGVAGFSDIYRPVWVGCAFPASAEVKYAKYHTLLVQQMAACVLPVFLRCSAAAPQKLAVFAAENVLLCTNGSEMTLEDLLELTQPILK